MNGMAEKLAFGALAAGLHVLAFAAIPDTGAQSQGAGGEGRVTLQGATAQIEAMVAAWTAPPETAEPVNLARPQPPTDEPPAPDLPRVEQAAIPPATAAPLPDLPVAPSLPTAAQLPLPRPAPAPEVATAPSLPRPQPDQSAEPRQPPLSAAPPAATPPDAAQRPAAPAAPPPPDALKMAEAAQSPPPPAEPETPPAERARSASAAAQAQKAAGRGGAQRAGTEGKAQTDALGPGQRQSLIAQWGAQIIDRIERTKRTPRRLRGGGRVVLRLQVSRAGGLLSVSVGQSSGNAELDAAAIRAVRRAGGFPPAPKGLTKPAYSFSLPVRFNG